MAESVTIQQESRRETLTFRFEGDRLVRRHADRSGANEISVPYADIDVRNWTTATVDRLRRYRFAVGAFCIVSALLAAAPLLPKASRATLAVAATVTLALGNRPPAQGFRRPLHHVQNPGASNAVEIHQGPT